jgi:hypothetical protein
VADPRRLPLRAPAHADLVRRHVRPAQGARIAPKHIGRFPEQLSHLVGRHTVARVTERLDGRRYPFLLGQRRRCRRARKEQSHYRGGARNRSCSRTSHLGHSPEVCPQVVLGRAYLRRTSAPACRKPCFDSSRAMTTCARDVFARQGEERGRHFAFARDGARPLTLRRAIARGHVRSDLKAVRRRRRVDVACRVHRPEAHRVPALVQAHIALRRDTRDPRASV